MNKNSALPNTFSWIIGVLFTGIAIVNIFWGNDPEFGVFIFMLSLIFYPPVNVLFKRITGYTIPVAVKIILFLLIIWASLGVGELLNKIELMIQSF